MQHHSSAGCGQPGSHQVLRNMPRVFAVAAFVLAGLLAAWPMARWLRGQDPETELSRRDFMRTKLLYAQNIMEGITTRNFTLIEQGASEIRRITEAGQWLVADTPEYRHLSDDLRSIADRIASAARDRNLDSAAFRYFDMTVNCMDCHQYARDNRIY